GAAIASLWSVDDTATAALMNQFYIALNQGKTKAEALRFAQRELIHSERFQHPHDWAGFILIGNGL
ncbi:MAG: CHAT domain-containing protein, partial [Cyanobacteria bacterium P01_C01_bin.121]